MIKIPNFSSYKYLKISFNKNWCKEFHLKFFLLIISEYQFIFSNNHFLCKFLLIILNFIFHID